MRVKKVCPKPSESFSKKNFLQQYLNRQRELGKRQREYKKILSTKLKSRKDTILETSYQNAVEQLRLEKNKLRAQIWVATGVTHKRENERYLKNIQCHVQCQEHLAVDIRNLKVSIQNLEREISRVNKQVYELNRRTVPDSQHQAYVARARKKMSYLENQLEVGIRRECGFTAANVALREELITVLNHRTFFNDSYSKLMQRLNSDKKYLIDLIDYALGMFDGCIELFEKINSTTKKEVSEQNMRKVELQGLLRKIAADGDNSNFMDVKAKSRVLADLQPKEYKRRKEFRAKHNKKINLYNDVLDKILKYSKTEAVSSVIAKFQEQESIYYSYFNYANEMSYHMTLLNNSVNNLYSEIEKLRHENRYTYSKQESTIETLQDTLKMRRAKNEELQKECKANDERLESLLQGFETLFELANANASPLMMLLGDHEHINLVNVRGFLKVLERRIINILASVYVMERDDENIRYEKYIVKQIEKICDRPSELEAIVLTQQCPECAEGEAFNVDDAGDGGIVNSVKEAKKKLYDKVIQPEMQYRLHNISQCRLPRSKMLAAKRNL